MTKRIGRHWQDRHAQRAGPSLLAEFGIVGLQSIEAGGARGADQRRTPAADRAARHGQVAICWLACALRSVSSGATTTPACSISTTWLATRCPTGGAAWSTSRRPRLSGRREAVFVDEISRCRPDLQNKLFPIIHERRVQGIALDRLVYRWSAMNPPPSEEDDDEPTYRGSEALDVALADRFAFVARDAGLGFLRR